MQIRVGRWDCQVCGNIGNLGPETSCSNCGASRPANVKFYLPTDAEVVRDSSKIEEAKAGPDWICGHCESQNKFRENPCRSCGNPKDELSEDVSLKTKTYRDGEAPTHGNPDKQEESDAMRKWRAKGVQKESALRSMSKLILLGILAVVVGLSIFIYGFPKTIEVQVDSFSWQRSIQFAHYEAVQEKAWSLPDGAFNVSSSREIHHYDQVLEGYVKKERQVKVQVGSEKYVCGQKDMGNGYFQDVYCTRPVYDYRTETYDAPVYQDVPVYKTQYRYQIMRWVDAEKYKRSLSGEDHEAIWPKLPGSSKEWREARRNASYFIVVSRSNGEQHKEQISESQWQSLSLGATLKAKEARLIGSYMGLAK